VISTRASGRGRGAGSAGGAAPSCRHVTKRGYTLVSTHAPLATASTGAVVPSTAAARAGRGGRARDGGARPRPAGTTPGTQNPSPLPSATPAKFVAWSVHTCNWCSACQERVCVVLPPLPRDTKHQNSLIIAASPQKRGLLVVVVGSMRHPSQQPHPTVNAQPCQHSCSKTSCVHRNGKTHTATARPAHGGRAVHVEVQHSCASAACGADCAVKTRAGSAPASACMLWASSIAFNPRLWPPPVPAPRRGPAIKTASYISSLGVLRCATQQHAGMLCRGGGSRINGACQRQWELCGLPVWGCRMQPPRLPVPPPKVCATPSNTLPWLSLYAIRAARTLS
jgi:hypothetical protein